MAAVVACVSGSGSWAQLKGTSSIRNVRRNDNSNKTKKGYRVSCVYSAAVTSDPYKTLRITPSASESEVKKAFRQLALQYHPDVCRGSNCGVQFHQIYEAYDIVINNLRGEPIIREEMEKNYYDEYNEDEPLRGMNEQDWDTWEEWMGWEGAGIRDYSSHINPYI